MRKNAQGRILLRKSKYKNNNYLRKKHNIPTIESKLFLYRPNTYYRLKSTMSIAYLNDKQYVNSELRKLEEYILELKEN